MRVGLFGLRKPVRPGSDPFPDQARAKGYDRESARERILLIDEFFRFFIPKRRSFSMKKIVFLLLRGILLFSLAIGCSGQKKESSKSENSVQKIQTESPSSEKDKKPTQREAPLVTFIELGSVRCIPCRMMQPIMAEIEKEYAGQVKVVFYDVWTPEGRPYAEQYQIRVIPTQVFLDKDGNEYFRHEGYFPKEELVKVLKQKGVK